MRKPTAWMLIALMLWQPAIAFADVQPLAADGLRPTLDQAANGTPVINIANPDRRGLSHNLYNQFDVGSQGLVLNNSGKVSLTQQAGYIEGNPNLLSGSARVILNEVIAPNPSQLNGYIEVAGRRADVIVANPWGISCNGCGFINTGRATLATGAPTFSAEGHLQGFDVQGGNVLIEGAGVNALGADRFDILSRSLTLNAEVLGRDVNLVLGKQQVAYADLAVSGSATDAAAPTLALDSSALGGIYANRIRLLSSEDGLGVHLDAPLAAQTGDVTLDVNGNLRFADVSAAGGISASADVIQVGTASTRLVSGGPVELAASGDLLVDGASITSLQGVTLDAGDRLYATGIDVDAKGGIALTADDSVHLDAASAFTSDASIGIQATSLDGGLSATLHAPTVSLAVNDGLQIAGALDLLGDLAITTAGTLEIDTAISLPGAVAVQANDLLMTGSGELRALDIGITADSVQADHGSAMISATDMSLAATRVNTGGDLIALGDIRVTADTASNLGLWYAGDNLVVDIVDQLANGDETTTAAMVAGSILVRDSGASAELVNSGSLIQSRNGILFDLAHVTNTRTNEEIGSEYNFSYEAIDTSAADLRLRVTRTNTEVLLAEGLPGEIVAGGDIQFTGDVLNDASTLYTPGSITIDGDLVNQDRVLIRTIREELWDFDDGSSTPDWIIPLGTREEQTGERLYATVYAGGDLTINGNVASSTGVPGDLQPWAPTQQQLSRIPPAPDITQTGDIYSGALLDEQMLAGLLNSALFSVDMTPASPYLIESRYQYADWKGFHGSDYLLGRVGWVADGTVKLLGDEFAELTLARQQIVAMTGRPLLSSEYADEIEQYAALVSNAIYAAESLALAPGISLTTEQINQLTADIVWPETKVIAGIEVMVPVLYLAPGGSMLEASGAIIAATNIYFNGADVDSAGTLAAHNDLVIDADQVRLAGDIRAGDEVAVTAADSLTIQSAVIEANDIYLASDGDITIETYAEHSHRRDNGVKVNETLLARQAAIEAANRLSINSGANINLHGAALSGSTVELDAADSVLLGAVRSQDGIRAYTGHGMVDTDRVRYTVSTINSLINTLIDAENNIVALGTDINAGGDIALYASGDISLLAAINSDYSFVANESDRIYGSKTTEEARYQELADVVSLRSGGNVLINTEQDAETGKLLLRDDAQGDIYIEGANVSAVGTTGIYAGNELFVTSVVENAYYHKETRREYDTWASETAGAVGALLSGAGIGSMVGLATGQEVSFELKGSRAVGSTSQTLRDSLFSSLGDTVLLAGEGVTLAAGDYHSDNLYISAGLNEGSTATARILGLQTSNTRYREETDYAFGQTQGLGSMATRATFDTGLSAQHVSWHGAAMDITDSVAISSANNLILQGTTIEADGAIDLFAGGSIVFDVGHSSSSYSQTLTSDANLGEYLEAQSGASNAFAEVTSLAAGREINITSGGDQIYVGTQMQSGDDITLTSQDGAISFEAARDTASTSYSEQSSDFSWVTMKSKGSYDEVLHMVSLQPGGNLVIDAAQGISVDIEKIDGKTGRELVDAIVARNPDMAWLKDLADQGEIDWNEVEAMHERWNEEQESLGAGASAVIAIVVTTLTGPAGKSVVGALQSTFGASVTAGTTAAGLGATAAVASTQAVVSSAATQLVTGTINNGGKLDRAFSDLGSRESLEGLGVGALTAGLTVGVDRLFDEYWKVGRLDPSKPVETNSVYGITKGFDLGDWRGQLGFTMHGATEGLMNAAVMDAIYGGDFSDYLRDSMESQGNDVLSALAFYKVGDFADGKTKGAGNEGDVSEFLRYVEGGTGRVLLHGVVGGAITEITSGDFRNGFAAAGLNQLLTPGLNTSLSEISKEGPNWRRAGSQLAGLTGALLVDGNLNQGSWIALQADSYNRQLHREEFSLIAENYKEYAEQRGISEEKALQELVWFATSQVDAAHALDKGQAGFALLNDFNVVAASIFLKDLSNAHGPIVHNDGVSTMPFQATDTQYFDSSVNRHELRLIEDGFNGELAGVGRRPLLSSYGMDIGAGDHSLVLSQSRAEAGPGKEVVLTLGGGFIAPMVFSLAAVAGAEAITFSQAPGAYTYNAAVRSVWTAEDLAYGLFGMPGSMVMGYGAAGLGASGVASRYGDDVIEPLSQIGGLNAGHALDGSVLAEARGASIVDEFHGPLIGFSGYRSIDDFSYEAFLRYQRYSDEAYDAVLRAEAGGRLVIPDGVSRETIIGQKVDRAAQWRLKNWVRSEGLSEGAGDIVAVNRWLRDPAGTGLYRIPDLRIDAAGAIFDGTIGYKWYGTPQVRDFFNFSFGEVVTIVRPQQLGGSYSILRPGL